MTWKEHLQARFAPTTVMMLLVIVMMFYATVRAAAF
jgi:hypothetical protein